MNSGQTLATYYFTECGKLISADTNDATVTDAEIEAFFTEEALALV